MTVVIEAGIPVPKNRSKEYEIGETIYNIGIEDSVLLFDLNAQALITRLNRINKKKNTQRKFTTKSEGKGFRIWRTA